MSRRPGGWTLYDFSLVEKKERKKKKKVNGPGFVSLLYKSCLLACVTRRSDVGSGSLTEGLVFGSACLVSLFRAKCLLSEDERDYATVCQFYCQVQANYDVARRLLRLFFVASLPPGRNVAFFFSLSLSFPIGKGKSTRNIIKIEHDVPSKASH